MHVALTQWFVYSCDKFACFEIFDIITARVFLPKGLSSYQYLSLLSKEFLGLCHKASHFGLSLDTYLTNDATGHNSVLVAYIPPPAGS